MHTERGQYCEFPFTFRKDVNRLSVMGSLLPIFQKLDDGVMRLFRYTYCPDEVFLQTLLCNSFLEIIVMKRFFKEIDWERGKPNFDGF